MKLTLAFILFFTFQLYANGYGQQKINLKAKKIEVKEVLSSIEKQTNYRFLYNNDLIELNNTVAIHAKNAGLEEVLPDLFNGTALTYLIMDNDLIVVKENPAIARDVVVRGQVMDDKGAPLSGVSVMVKGTTTGTTTNANGEFSLTVPNANAILAFTSVGYDDLEQPLSGSNTINVVMKASQKVMDQVVVIGYGTAAKRDLTGSIVKIEGKEVADKPNTNPVASLQGKVAGLSVVPYGTPGKTPDIRIRVLIVLVL
ncbi:MAG: carboxypeptidase-like regulatory domain-containing protein [Sphingobacteriales bacterium]|nr:carboxypeptidase-like regulatory domain-containing protein [Sphingobacteriales bacterium]